MARISRAAMALWWAEIAAKRSTCARLQVGAVITDTNVTQVFAVGYNGNARGLANDCDSEIAGNCGCLHAEENALLKAPFVGRSVDRILWCTHSPCLACCKRILNAGVTIVAFKERYRDLGGLQQLEAAGVALLQWDPQDEQLFVYATGRGWDCQVLETLRTCLNIR